MAGYSHYPSKMAEDGDQVFSAAFGAGRYGYRNPHVGTAPDYYNGAHMGQGEDLMSGDQSGLPQRTAPDGTMVFRLPPKPTHSGADGRARQAERGLVSMSNMFHPERPSFKKNYLQTFKSPTKNPEDLANDADNGIYMDSSLAYHQEFAYGQTDSSHDWHRNSYSRDLRGYNAPIYGGGVYGPKDYKCGCGRAYTSQTALMHHTKKHHDGYVVPGTVHLDRETGVERPISTRNRSYMIQPRFDYSMNGFSDPSRYSTGRDYYNQHSAATMPSMYNTSNYGSAASRIGPNSYLYDTIGEAEPSTGRPLIDYSEDTQYSGQSRYHRAHTQYIHSGYEEVSENKEVNMKYLYFREGMNSFQLELDLALANIGGAYNEKVSAGGYPRRRDIFVIFPKHLFQKPSTWESIHSALEQVVMELNVIDEPDTTKAHFKLVETRNMTCVRLCALFLLCLHQKTSIQMFQEFTVLLCGLLEAADQLGPRLMGLELDITPKTAALKQILKPIPEARFSEQYDAELLPLVMEYYTRDFFPRFLLDEDNFQQISHFQFIGVDGIKQRRLAIMLKCFSLWLYDLGLTSYSVEFAIAAKKLASATPAAASN